MTDVRPKIVRHPCIMSVAKERNGSTQYSQFMKTPFRTLRDR